MTGRAAAATTRWRSAASWCWSSASALPPGRTTRSTPPVRGSPRRPSRPAESAAAQLLDRDGLGQVARLVGGPRQVKDVLRQVADRLVAVGGERLQHLGDAGPRGGFVDERL